MEQAQVTLIAKLRSENEKLRLENDDLRLKETTTFPPRGAPPAPHHHHNNNPATDPAAPGDSNNNKLYHQSPLDVSSDGTKHSLPHQGHHQQHHPWNHHLHTSDESSKFSVKDLQQASGAYRSSSPPVNFQSFIVNSMHGVGNNNNNNGGVRNGAANKLDAVYDEDKPMLRVASATALKQPPQQRLLGEIAFQLEQRILAYVFQGQVTFYGFTVLNVREKIAQAATRPFTGMLDEGYRRCLLGRHAELMDKLACKAGYNPQSHPMFAQFIINSYGRLGGGAGGGGGREETQQDLLDQPEAVRKALVGVAPSYVLRDMLVLLGGLQYMAGKDGKALFLW